MNPALFANATRRVVRCVRSPVMGAAVAALLFASLPVTLAPPPAAWGSSHLDAPLISLDPYADVTDVFVFVGDGTLNTVVHVAPFSEPGGGPNYSRFADDARYSIHFTDPATGQTAIRYDFLFSDVNPTTQPGLKNPLTALSYGVGSGVGPLFDIDWPTRNYTQTYTVLKNESVVASGVLTAPPNVGVRTTPLYNDPSSGPTFGFAVSGATTLDELDPYTRAAIRSLPGNERVFAGPREDASYADVSATFDLLDARIIDNNGDTGDGLGQDGGGVDGFRGFNVLAYALEIPLDQLSAVPGFPLVGVYASVSRPRITLRRTDGDPVSSGAFIQVSRMGNPWFNKVVVPLKDKDKYNRTSPTGDAGNFASYAENPELAKLINATFGTAIPETGRSDLVSLFIPDVLRVDTSTGAVPLAGQVGFNRLSVFGGDLTNGVPSGYPNGRRFGDDVFDILLTALAGGSAVLGDNVAANDQVFHQVFPYSATPNAGTRNSKDSP